MLHVRRVVIAAARGAMIRIVLDTNVLISALLSSQGPPAQVLLMILLDSDTQLCVSGAIYAEYEEVARRSCFKRSDSEIEAMLRAIRERGFWIKPTSGSAPVPIPMMISFWNARRLRLPITW